MKGYRFLLIVMPVLFSCASNQDSPPLCGCQTKAGLQCTNIEFGRFSAFSNESIDDFIGEATQIEGIDSVHFSKDTLKVFCSQLYFEESRNMSYCWMYYYYNDIYCSIFSFEEVNFIMVYLNNENYTFFPVIGDYDGIYPFGGIMSREYIPCMNLLDYIHVDDSSVYFDFERKELKKNLLMGN